LRSNGLANSESSDGSSGTGECTSVSLGEGGGGCSLGVDTWRVGSVSLTRGERVVGVAAN
jgi:hypothetical protein